MHICIFNHYARLPEKSGYTRHFEIARWMVNHGHRVTLVASAFDHMTRTNTKVQAGEWYATQEVDGVCLIWIWSRPHEGNNLSRFLNMIDYGYYAWRYSKHIIRPDVVVGIVNHHFTALSAWAAARHFRVPFVMEVADVWPDTLVDMGLSQFHPAVLVFGALDRFLLPRAQEVITALPLATDRLISGGAKRNHITFIPNGVDLSHFQFSTEAADDPVEPFTILYAGTHGQVYGLDVVLKAAKLVEQKVGSQAIRFVFMGDGPEKPNLQAYASEMKLGNIQFKDPVPKAELAVELRRASALIFHTRTMPVHRFGISPLKISDYMASGRPVIFACASGNNTVAEAGAGLSVSPESPEEIARAVLNLYQTPYYKRAEMGQQGRAFVDAHYDSRKLASRYLSVLQKSVEDCTKKS